VPVGEAIGQSEAFLQFKERLSRVAQVDRPAEVVLGLSSYSQQSVVLNNSVWKRLFSEIDIAPEVVYLELEKIVGMLLERDLQDSKSLAWRIMFDPVLRNATLRELDGARSCWFLEGLTQRLRLFQQDSAQTKSFDGCGTVFFWGINRRGRRVPLCLGSPSRDKPTLRGIDDRGDHCELSYTPQSIVKALRKKRLLPSLFVD